MASSSPPPKLPIPDRRNILITSALPYVTNVPHLGNIIGGVLSADVFARYCRLRGYNTIYICGTDEYGMAAETKAMEEKCTSKEICDKYHKIHDEVYKWFDIKFDKFGKTSSPEQTEVCHAVFHKLMENNWLTENTMQQYYCDTCQRFLGDHLVEGICPNKTCGAVARGDQCEICSTMLNPGYPAELVEPKCKVCKNTPRIRDTDHLFLDLPKLRDKLVTYILDTSLTGMWSKNAIQATIAWLKEAQKPCCITRYLKWGVPVPHEKYKDKVFYDWYDAPIGYISITAGYTPDWEKWWKNPDNVELFQFIGKDSIPFHTIMFPSALLGTGEKWTMMKTISVTEYLNYETGKFSKSEGTGVFCNDAKDTNIPPEVWRYYLLMNRPEASDTNFTWADLQAKLNNELLNNLGNFIDRVLTFVAKPAGAGYGSIVPDASNADSHPLTKMLVEKTSNLVDQYLEAMEKVELTRGLKCVMAISSEGNAYLQENQFWKLYNEDSTACAIVIKTSVGLVYLVACLLEPFMPSFSNEVLRQLNLPAEDVSFIEEKGEIAKAKSPWDFVQAGHKIGKPAPLFKELKDDDVVAYREKYAGSQAERSSINSHLQSLIGRADQMSTYTDEELERFLSDWIVNGNTNGIEEVDIYKHSVEELFVLKKRIFLVNLRNEERRPNRIARKIRGQYEDKLERRWRHSHKKKTEGLVEQILYQYLKGTSIVKGVKMLEYRLKNSAQLKVLCKLIYDDDFICDTMLSIQDDRNNDTVNVDDTESKGQLLSNQEIVSMNDTIMQLKEEKYVVMKEQKRAREEQELQVSELEKEIEKLKKENKKVSELEKEIEKLRKENKKLKESEKAMEEKIQDMKGKMRVFCRVRPIATNEDRSIQCNLEEKKVTLKHNEKDLPFVYNKIFGEMATQKEIFDEILPVISRAMEGRKVCIFAYGQSGAGKTHTMLGNMDLENEADEGIVPRCVKLVIDEATKKEEEGWVYRIKISVLEIYNEIIQDLLSSKRSDSNQIKIQHDNCNVPIITGLSSRDVEGLDQTVCLIKDAIKKRAVGKTRINEHSSRSHCIFVLSISGENMKIGQKVEGVVNLIDLAGSENILLSGVSGDSERESQCINKSLSAMKGVISALSSQSIHIPFRDSKLTHFLMGSLSMDARVVTIINIRPEKSFAEQTLSSLRFGLQASLCEFGGQPTLKVGSPSYSRIRKK